MQRISFTPDREILLFGKPHRVESVTDKEVVLRRPSGASSTYTLQTLLAHSYSGNLKSMPQTKARGASDTPRPRRSSKLLIDLSAKQQDAARRRWQLLRAIGDDVPIKRGDERLEAFVAESAKALGFVHPPSLAAVIRWRRDLRRGGNDPQSLAPRFHRRGGKGKLRFEPAVTREMDAVIENFYLTPESASAKAAHETLVALLMEKNRWLGAHEQLKIPSYATFQRRIRQYDAYDIVAARAKAPGPP